MPLVDNFPDTVKSLKMSFTDCINYVLFKNPVSTTVIDSGKYMGSAVGSIISRPTSSSPQPPEFVLPKGLKELQVHRIVMNASPFIKLAGLSGAAAVLFGAYGAHSLLQKPGLEERKQVYLTANRYHFFHTLALLAVPLSRCPKTVGTVMTTGMVIFCGTCYYDSFTGDTSLRKFTPVGGSLLVLGWLCFLL